MKFSKELLISPEQDIKMSSVYVGYCILKIIEKDKKITIFKLFSEIKLRCEFFSYSNTIYALIFLYINGFVDFSEPYIYNLKLNDNS
jgi:hypothetical protein